MSKTYKYLFWLSAVLLLFFSNNNLLITDSVESNYALTAKEMLLSGDWISPQIYGHYWFDKPVMFYWLTAIAFKIFGFTEFAARFFPAVFGLAALGLVYWGGSKLYNERTGFFSGMILLSCVEFFLISKSVITDAVLFLFFSGTLLFFYLAYTSQSRRYWYLMYICAALATLTKGPIGFLLPGLIITLFIVWQREWRLPFRMHLFTGTALFALLVLPWYGMMIYLHGADFIDTFLGTHNFLRATVSEHPRDDVFYYYTVVNLLAFFPWSLLVPAIAYRAWREGQPVLAVKEKFLLLWAATVFIFFQCMATKYITYTYPMLFPGALLLGAYITKHEEILKKRLFLSLLAGVFILLMLAGYWTVDKGLAAGTMLSLLPLSLGMELFVYFALRRYTDGNFVGIGTAAVVFYLALTVCIAVPFSAQRSAKDLAMLLPQLTKADSVGVYGHYPTSAVFYSGKQFVKLLPAKAAADFAPQAYSWNSKNVMPYAAVEQELYPMVVVRRKYADDFLSLDAAEWNEECKLPNWIVMQRLVQAG